MYKIDIVLLINKLPIIGFVTQQNEKGGINYDIREHRKPQYGTTAN